jgi:hypothetical protein
MILLTEFEQMRQESDDMAYRIRASGVKMILLIKLE